MIPLPTPQAEPPIPKPPISNWLSEFEEKLEREFRRRTGLDYKATMAQVIEAAQPRPGMQVLDVGTGTGVIARQLVTLIGEKGRIIGVDATEEMVEQARLAAQSAGAGRKIEWQVAPAENLPFSAGSFDLVTCTMAFHVMQAARFIKEAGRVLKPDGRLLITAQLRPNKVNEWLVKMRRNYYQYIVRDQVEAEATFHSATEVLEMLAVAGFRQRVIQGLRPLRSWDTQMFSLIKAVK